MPESFLKSPDFNIVKFRFEFLKLITLLKFIGIMFLKPRFLSFISVLRSTKFGTKIGLFFSKN